MNYFQELAAKYDAWFQTPHGRYVHRYEREAVMALATVEPGMSIADIGCGTGIYTEEFLRAGANVVGVDISPEMLAIAQEKNKQYAGKGTFVAGDAAKLPFETDSFDMVTSISAMEFFTEPQGCLQEMYRVVRPGGRLVIATLNSLSPWSIQRRLKAMLRRTIFSSARFYSISDLRRLMDPHPISDWRGCIFVPPFAPNSLIASPDRLEEWGQRHCPGLGTFIVARIDKK